MKLPDEATITINGTTLTNAQAMSLRVAVTSFRIELHEPEMAEVMGDIGKMYDECLIEVEQLLVSHQ
jgi:hypothetical protein